MDPVHHQSIDSSDYPPSSGISEVDSLSDSDWLDLSSSRESDDNNSISSNSHCGEGDGSPYSRRSSMSAGSSRDGEIDAWAGLVDQVAFNLSRNLPSTADADVVEPTPTAYVSAANRDVGEDQRVKDALDQSMISTLSASRSSSLGAPAHHSTPQASLRDLRLSFPDPLTSSRNELDETYESPSPSETSFSASDRDDAIVPCDVKPSLAADTGSVITPAIPQTECPRDHFHTTCYLDVVLYGRSHATQWDFIDNLVEKVAVGGQGHAIILSHKITVGYTRLLCVQGMRQCDGFSSLVVTVTDRTEGSTWKENDVRSPFASILRLTSTFVQSSTKSDIGRPSLAVIYLPSSRYLPSSTEHDFYLPVLVPPSTAFNSLGHEDDVFDAVHHTLDLLAIPAGKILHLKESDESRILDIEELDRLQPSHVHQVFQSISAPYLKKSGGHFPVQLTSIHVVTLYVQFVTLLGVIFTQVDYNRLGLLSLVLAVIVNNTFRTSVITVPMPATSTPNHSWSLLGPVNNRSTPTPPNVVTSDMAIIPSSLKDFALAVFNPATTASAKHDIVQPTPGRTVSGPKPTAHDKQLTWSERARSSRDIISLPISYPLSERGPNIPPSKATGSQTDTSASSLSVRIADSLSVFFDVKPVLDVVFDDMNELLETINRQAGLVVERSKGKAESLGDVFQHRNGRARGRAKELKDMAEEVITSTGQQIKGRAGMARARARALKDYCLTSVPWSTPNRLNRGANGEKLSVEKRKRKPRKSRARKLFSTGG